MNKSIASVLRKIAQMIVIDETPETEEEILLRRQRVCEEPGGLGVSIRKPRVQVQRDETEMTQRPKLRPMRRQPAYQSEWSGDGGKEKRNEYQAEYRANGNDVGTRYVKKPKV
jgi:hypothetical protein